MAIETMQIQADETLSLKVVRRIAARYKLQIRQSRGPFSLTNRGQFQLLDRNNIVIGGVNYDMSIEEILSYITELGYRV
jgi:hypothetical protein